MKAVEASIRQLGRDERAALLAHLVDNLADAFPAIESTPDVCGGEARIVRIRIPVWLLVRGFEMGSSEAELMTAYPTLRAEDLAHTWRYALRTPMSSAATSRPTWRDPAISSGKDPSGKVNPFR